jgi:LysM domain.
LNVDIFITEKTGKKREVRIPWLPEKIQFSSGGTRFASYDIMDRGEIKVPNGKNIGEFSWESTLPGKNRVEILPFLRGKWISPKTYQEIFSVWRVQGTPLRLIVTGTPINHDVYLSDYNVTYFGAFGDYEYDITFSDFETINIIAAAAENKNKRAEVVSTQKSHTVVTGDNLWSIAQKYLGNGVNWPTVYNTNKTIIEETAKKRGYKSSNNGHWIFPGTILKIPNKG